MKLLLIIFSINAYSQCADMDIMLVADFSGSVTSHETFVLDALGSFASTLNVNESVNVGLVLFSDWSFTACQLTNDSDGLMSVINSLRNKNASGSSNMGDALQSASIQLISGSHARKFIIVISDGDVNVTPPEQTLRIAEQLHVLGIGLCAVLITNESSRPEFMRQISDGCYAESGYETLAQAMRDLSVCM